jgi:hypothetical protein
MQQIKQNEATASLRRVPVVLVDAADGQTPETGITLTLGDMKLTKAGGGLADHAGSLVELAGGDYYYELTAGEVDTLGYLVGRIVKSGVRTYRFAVQIVGFDPAQPWIADVAVTALDSAPPEPSTMSTWLRWLFTRSKRKFIQTATGQTLRNAADTADVATAQHSHTGDTYTRQGWTS